VVLLLLMRFHPRHAFAQCATSDGNKVQRTNRRPTDNTSYPLTTPSPGPTSFSLNGERHCLSLIACCH
jgi:hypothetical protein